MNANTVLALTFILTIIACVIAFNYAEYKRFGLKNRETAAMIVLSMGIWIVFMVCKLAILESMVTRVSVFGIGTIAVMVLTILAGGNKWFLPYKNV